MANNVALKKKNFFSAMDAMDNMSQQDALNSILSGIADSPLFDLAENWVAEQATNAAANVVNTVTSKITDNVAGPLAAARNAAFSMVASAMLFRQELIYYFAMKTAEQIINEIEGPKGMRANLTELRDAIRRLYNALMALNHTGDFYAEYLAKLRQALALLVGAHKKLDRVKAGFEAKGNRFQDKLYLSVKDDLDAAAKLILPPTPKPDASVRTPMMRPMIGKAPKKTGNTLLDKSAADTHAASKSSNSNVPGLGTLLPESLGVQTTSSRQYLALQAMWQIPKLVLGMLEAYDLYALHVLKLNALLSSFKSISAPKVEMFSFFKKYITDVLDKSSEECLAIIADMATSLNGESHTYDEPIIGFSPDPRAVCARSPLWGIRVHALKVMLEGIDVNSMARMNEGAELEIIHKKAVDAINNLDYIKGANVILKRNDGMEEVGDLEPYILTLASQSALALVDKTQFATTAPGQYKSNTVVMVGRRAMSRVDLSLTHCDDVVGIMNTYISETKPRLHTSALGDSLLGLCDQFGMDKLKDSLMSGNIGSVFMMSPKTATYVGAAVTALWAVYGQTKTEAARSCIADAINDLQVQDRAKQTQMSRTANNAAKEQMKQNDQTCSDLRQKKKKTEQCVTGGGLSLAATGAQPQTLSDKIRNTFTGVLGDSSAGSGVTPATSNVTTGETTTFASMFTA
jgi:hypothetical protein